MVRCPTFADPARAIGEPVNWFHAKPDSAGAARALQPAGAAHRPDVCRRTSTDKEAASRAALPTVLTAADEAAVRAAARKAEAAPAATQSQAAVHSRAGAAGRGHRARWGNSACPRDRDAIPAGMDKARTRSAPANQEIQGAKR